MASHVNDVLGLRRFLLALALSKIIEEVFSDSDNLASDIVSFFLLFSN